MLQGKMTDGEGIVDNNDQAEKNAELCVGVSTEDHTQKVGCTNDASVRDHSRVFEDWKQQVRDDHWDRMLTELIDEGLPN